MLKLEREAGRGARAILLLLSLILAGQTLASRSVSLNERLPGTPSLHLLPATIGQWATTEEPPLEENVLNYLRPDDYLTRVYVNQKDNTTLSLFVAYFKSLQKSYGPHSPRICLPGSGWLIKSSSVVDIAVPGRAERMPVNRYLMKKGNDQILVLYWYQNNRRVWAEEFRAKLYLLPDLIRYRRSEVTLVRIITPVEEMTEEHAWAFSKRFAVDLQEPLESRLATID